MPEFPDVIVYIEALAERILESADFRKSVSAARFLFCGLSIRRLVPLKEGDFVALRRLGKRIVFALEDELFLIVHLMITRAVSLEAERSEDRPQIRTGGVRFR